MKHPNTWDDDTNETQLYMRGWKSITITFLIILLLGFWAGRASADEVTLSWQWPTEYCAKPGQTIGDPLPLTDIMAAEIYIAEAPIPRVPSSCDSNEVDVPPSGAIIQQVVTPDTTVNIDLPCGPTYHFVMRVQATNGEWSNFSAEAQRVLDCGRPNVPIIISLS